MPERDITYDGFTIEHHGQEILAYYPGDPLFNCSYLTLNRDTAHFLQMPLDEKRFALCFGGWLFGIDNAPELVIVRRVGRSSQGGV